MPSPHGAAGEFSEEKSASAEKSAKPTSPPADAIESPETAGAKSPVSARKILANKLNSSRSTGPKTSRGKSYSRSNAVKHGLLAGETGFTSGDEGRTDPEYTKLLSGLRNYFRPLEIMEDLLVQRIATCFWGLKMTLRVTVGEGWKQTLTGPYASLCSDPGHQNIVTLWLSVLRDHERRQMNGIHDRRLTLAEGQIIKQVREDPLGVVILLIFLEEIRSECNQTGDVSQAHRNLLRGCYGSDADRILASSAMIINAARNKSLSFWTCWPKNVRCYRSGGIRSKTKQD